MASVGTSLLRNRVCSRPDHNVIRVITRGGRERRRRRRLEGTTRSVVFTLNYSRRRIETRIIIYTTRGQRCELSLSGFKGASLRKLPALLDKRTTGREGRRRVREDAERFSGGNSRAARQSNANNIRGTLREVVTMKSRERQSVRGNAVTDRETREKTIGDSGRKVDGRVRENTMGHCCALGTLEQCRLPDSVNNPQPLTWGPRAVR